MRSVLKTTIRLCTAATLISLPALADVVFTDTTFPTANYSATLYKNDVGMDVSWGQCAACGNPGQALQILEDGTSGDSSALALLNSTFTYDPSISGPIGSINASVDKDITLSLPATGTNSFHPLIEQDGNFYFATIFGPGLVDATTSGWNNIAQSGLTAADFTQYDFTTGSTLAGHPDFAGDTLTFGIVQTTYLPGPESEEVDYDNLNIAVTSAPEPSCLLPFAGLLACLFVRRRPLAHAK